MNSKKLNRIKNFIKKNIKIFALMIICSILFTCVGVYASYNYLASNIEYKKDISVADALDDLYSNALTLGEIKASSDLGNYGSKSTTLELNKGKYLVIEVVSFIDLGSSTGSSVSELIESPTNITLPISFSCENCEYNMISDSFVSPYATSKANSWRYLTGRTIIREFEVTINEDNTILTGAYNTSATSNVSVTSLYLQSIKLK